MRTIGEVLHHWRFLKIDYWATICARWYSTLSRVGLKEFPNLCRLAAWSGGKEGVVLWEGTGV